MCPEWRDNFDQFYEDMGEVPEGMSLERVDNDLGYSPSNCTWASLRDQLNNQRRNVRIEHLERTLTIGQWATKLGVEYDTLWRRLRKYKMDTTKAFAGTSLRDTGWSHGTRTGYAYGCRCESCKAFNTERARKQRAKR